MRTQESFPASSVPSRLYEPPQSRADVQPFGAIAADYDAAFTYTTLGRWLRQAVWERLASAFSPGDRVLELGCGTGEDAIWLAQRGVHVVATDVSPAMLETARRKAETVGVADRISTAQLDLASPKKTDWAPEIDAIGSPISNLQSPLSKYDGAFSNFGALNCVPDRRPIADVLAHWVRPGAQVVVVVMGPLCPWEVAWHLARGEVRTAIRRFQLGIEANVGDRATVRVWYPSPRRLRSEFAPHFRPLQTVGIGAFLPPSYLSHLVDRWPRFFEVLASLDRRLGGVFPWTWLNDHYLMVFERT